MVNINYGSDPSVETLSFDVSDYGIPEERGPVFNVQHFGAKCDGVTNDTEAVRAALDALPNSGGTLLIPGMCGIDDTLLKVVGKDNITLKGVGPDSGFKALPQEWSGSRWTALLTVEGADDFCHP